MSSSLRIVVWFAAGAFVLTLGALVASAPRDGPVRTGAHTAPPEIVISPRLGHYDHRAGHYVWWR
jgi:hypothetical protein